MNHMKLSSIAFLIGVPALIVTIMAMDLADKLGVWAAIGLGTVTWLALNGLIITALWLKTRKKGHPALNPRGRRGAPGGP